VQGPALWHNSLNKPRAQTQYGERNNQGDRAVTQQKPIDIFREFIDQYAREDMLAFFEFTVNLAGQGLVPGLCRISQPKAGSSRLKYLSLTFVIDTPEEETRPPLQKVLSRIEETKLRTILPQVAGVVPTPTIYTGSEHYIKQIDVLLSDNSIPDQGFILEKLVPALREITQIEISEVSWWDVRAEDLHDLHSRHVAEEEHSPSLVERLKRFFGSLKA